MNRILSTSRGREGINISASTEKSCGKQLLEILPKDWKVSFDWCQILFSDTQYEIIKEKKLIEIAYNQNLAYWWKKLMPEIKQKLIKLGVIK